MQKERLFKVLDNIKESCERDEDDVEMFSEALDTMLENLLECDAFGTEGSVDPRGDQRITDYSMWKVEGIDD